MDDSTATVDRIDIGDHTTEKLNEEVTGNDDGGGVTSYPIGDRVGEQIQRNFTYHSPKGDQPTRYVYLRDQAMNLALDIARFTPASREQSLALTHLEEAIFYANAAIARNE